MGCLIYVLQVNVQDSFIWVKYFFPASGPGNHFTQREVQHSLLLDEMESIEEIGEPCFFFRGSRMFFV